MTLPPWKSRVPEEREAFIRFIIAELDAELDTKLRNDLAKIERTKPADMAPEDRVAFIRAVATSGLRAGTIERIGLLFGTDIAAVTDQIERLQSIGFEIKAPPGKRGAKSDHTPAYQNAAEDVPRIRALFVKHWGKRNRHDHPLAEEIAAQRWGLSEKEAADLIDKFQR